MSTATKIRTSPLMSGFCEHSGLHGRCPHAWAGVVCACACHLPPEDVSPDAPSPAPGDTAGSGLTLISSPDPAAIDQAAADALSAVAVALDQLGRALLPYIDVHGDTPEPLVLTFDRVQALRKRLAESEAVLESRAVRALGREQQLVLPDGRVVERRGGAKRTEWEHDRVAYRVAEKTVESAAYVHDQDSGEAVLDDALAAAVHAGVQELLACARPNWRTTELRKRDVRFDDLCRTEYGRATLQISSPAAATP